MNRHQTRALRFLQEHHVATLATGNSADLWAAAVFYANDGFSLYFVSAPSSRHGQNLLQDPHVAVTIQEDYSDWTKIQGIQLAGRASEVAGPEAEHARTLFARKFPDLFRDSALSALARAWAGVRWYKVVPNRCTFTDNTVRFGHRTEIPLPH